MSTMFSGILFSVLYLSVSASSLPSWHDLQCEPGHKYLFSDLYHTWQDAREECELYGGWLLSINSQQEQNCLVRFAHSSGLQAGWFWHDGGIYFSLKKLVSIVLFLVNDAADEGILVHARDNSDLTWVNHLFSCGGQSYMYHRGYDYYMLGLFGENDRATGAWCDVDETYSSAYFICEGLVE